MMFGEERTDPLSIEKESLLCQEQRGYFGQSESLLSKEPRGYQKESHGQLL